LIYLDAGAIFPMLVTEDRSAAAIAFEGRNLDRLCVSDLAAGEVASALSRLVRMQIFSAEDANRLCERFDAWRLSATQIRTISASDVALGTTYVRRWDLKLRLPDAIHLAACRRFGFALASFDARMVNSARAVGVELADL
jgi:uncharacterized protein